jgi:hypothetical protein
MSPANALSARAIRILAVIAPLTAAGLVIMMAHSWRVSRQAAADMRVVFRAQAPVLEEATKRESQRDRALSKKLAMISRAERSAKEPADIAQRLPAAFPPLPEPLVVSLPSHPSVADAPEVPAIITVPQADLKPLFDRLEDCRACQQQLATVQQDLQDERAKVSALTIERDASLKAARGGGFWSRLRSGAKWFAIGIAVGALAASSVHR